VVTLLVVPLDPLFEDEDVSLELEVVDVPELVVVDGVEATVVIEEFLASAGSCPETSTIVISSQLATNRARAPAMMRRRRARARASRVCLIAWPRARAAARSVSVIGLSSRSKGESNMPHSFDPARSKRVSER
jgi:hypothetical protein